MMPTRRALIAMMPAVILSRRAWAQGGPGYYQTPEQLTEHYGPVVEVPQDMSDWFEKLKRPDVADGRPHAPDDVMASAVSCCSAGDAYPIEIIEEASPPHGGREENGLARVTDTSKRQLIIRQRNENGSVFTATKYRQELVAINPTFAAPEHGKFAFHFSSDRVTREIDGNPTKTAWVFFRVTYDKADYTYCVVPLPPST